MTMTRKSIPPSIKETAFDCPHCGAFTTQTWYQASVARIGKGQIAFIGSGEFVKAIETERTISGEEKKKMKTWVEKLLAGDIFLESIKSGQMIYISVNNLFLSQCYNCDKVAVWVHDRLIYPPVHHGAQPNADLPDDILHDYEEARSILDLSPRGAAALLRLCIQKLCIHLGEKGKKLDDDIASLVAKGLNPLVQKSLDIVRVIGNEAVHPAVMDLKDDRATATTLFGLINAIASQMITHPKMVDEMYKKLPEGKRAEIDKRDAKSPTKTSEK
jgi:hypothetical protein